MNRLPQLPFLVDYLGLQADLTALLLSHAPFNQVNAVAEHKFLMDSDVAIDSLWQTARNGGAGAGIIVEDVRPYSDKAGSVGPVSELRLGFVILAERNVCLGPAGCGWQPENIEQAVVDLLHLKLIQPYGQLRAEGAYGGPANDWIDSKAGLYARRVTLKMLSGRKQSNTCDQVSIRCVAGQVQITCTFVAADLQIWYTTDGSFPSNDGNVNPQAQRYLAPFAASAGTVVRAMAYSSEANPSSLLQLTV